MLAKRNLALAVAVGSLLLYLPTAMFDFCPVDDGSYLQANDAVKNLDGLKTIWSTHELPKGATNWPIVFTTFWLEYRLWGDHPAGFHLVNAILHSLATWLVFRFLVSLNYNETAALLAAALFGFHPLQVETVAWITERKNVLSAVFLFAAIDRYAIYRKTNHFREYSLMLLAFTAALLSKSSVVFFPLLIVVTDWLLIDGKLSTASLKRAAIPLLMSIGASLVTVSADVIASRVVPPLDRIYVAPLAVWFYVFKFFWPVELIPLYPRWQLQNPGFWWGVPVVGLAIAVAGLFRFRQQLGKWTLWGATFFLVGVLPIVGIIPFGYMTLCFVADHFVYIPVLGLMVIVANASVAGIVRLKNRSGQRIAWNGLAIVLSLLALKTIIHSRVWLNDISYWSYCERKSPATYHDACGIESFRSRDYALAARHLAEIVKLRPNDVYALTSCGMCLFRSGNEQKGLQLMQRAVELRPADVDAELNLGHAYLRGDNLRGAIQCFQMAAQFAPEHPGAFVGLAAACQKLGEHKQAIVAFTEALALFPDDVESLHGIAISQEALHIFGDAERNYRKAANLDPARALAWHDLSLCLARQRKYRDAVEALTKGLTTSPESRELRSALAWLLATANDPAVVDGKRSQSIVQSLIKDSESLQTARLLDIYAASFAQAGDYENAVKFAELAAKKAMGAQRKSIEQRLELYRNKKPFRLP